MRKVFIFLIFSTMLFMVVSCSNNNTSGDQITTINDLVYEQKNCEHRDYPGTERTFCLEAYRRSGNPGV